MLDLDSIFIFIFMNPFWLAYNHVLFKNFIFISFSDCMYAGSKFLKKKMFFFLIHFGLNKNGCFVDYNGGIISLMKTTINLPLFML